MGRLLYIWEICPDQASFKSPLFTLYAFFLKKILKPQIFQMIMIFAGVWQCGLYWVWGVRWSQSKNNGGHVSAMSTEVMMYFPTDIKIGIF